MGGNVRETNLTKMKFFEEVAFKLSNEKDHTNQGKNIPEKRRQKITEHVQLGQILDKRYKETKTQLPLLKSLEQKQGVRSKSIVLSMVPAQLHLFFLQRISTCMSYCQNKVNVNVQN